MTDKNFIEFISAPEIQEKLFLLKFLAIIFSLAAAGFIVFAFRRIEHMRSHFFRDLKEFLSFKPYEASMFVKKWEATKKRLLKGWEAEAKLAIIESDALLNEILEKMAYTGESLGERLKKVEPGVLPNLEAVWQAHRIRNDIVHDPNYRLSVDRARAILEVYEEAFKHFEAL